MSPARKKKAEDSESGSPSPETPDLPALWNQWLSTFEQQANQTLGSLTTTEGYGRLMAAFMESNFRFNKATRSAAQTYMEAANLPSREDVQNLTDRLARVEDRLVDLHLAVERLASQGPTASDPKPTRPPRTKKAKSKSSAASAEATGTKAKSKKKAKAKKTRKKSTRKTTKKKARKA